MGKFLTGKELEDAVYNIIWDTKETLMIVSPFIKLDDYFKRLFSKHENNPRIHLLIVFGKNEKDVKRSMSKEDFDFFKKFLNVSIVYAPNLHAKYYGNEEKGIITSINLYDYSFKNNIEFGVYSQRSLMDRFSQSPDNEAWNECMEIAEKNEVVFIKRPVYENKKFIINLGKSYVKSDVLFDSTDRFYGYLNGNKVSREKLFDFPSELELGSGENERPERNLEENPTYGYCIRTGVKIKFNPEQPMTWESWRVWNQFGNRDFQENYCHKTGKLSYGKTSLRNPILY